MSSDRCDATAAGRRLVHELKHDGYRLQVHIRDGRVRLYTMNAADWTARYPRIVEQAVRIKGSAIIDAEVVCLDDNGVADCCTAVLWITLRSRVPSI